VNVLLTKPDNPDWVHMHIYSKLFFLIPETRRARLCPRAQATLSGTWA